MKKISLLMILCILVGCARKPINKVITTLPDDWTLVPIPNSLDKVGTIFAIKKNKQTYIPVKLNVEIESGIAETTTDKITKSISPNLLLSFLNSTDINISDTSHITSVFDISNTTLVRPLTPLSTPFEERKNDVIKELNFYNLDNSDVYIVTELLKAKTVNMNLMRQSETSLSVSNLITKIINLKKAGISFSKNDSTALKYDLKDSLAIFYKLTKIKLEHARFKDPVKKDSIVNIILTNRPAVLD